MIKQAKRNFIDNIADTFTDDPEPGRSFIIDVLDSPVNNSDNIARLLASGAAYGATNNYLKTGKLFPSIFDKGKGGNSVPNYINESKIRSGAGNNPIIQLEETERLLDYLDNSPEAGNLRKNLFKEIVLENNEMGGSIPYKDDFIKYVHDNHGGRLGNNLKQDIATFLSDVNNKNVKDIDIRRNKIIEQINNAISNSTGGSTGKMTVDVIPDDVLKHFYDDFSGYARYRITGTDQLKDHFKHFKYSPGGTTKQIDDIINYLHDFGRAYGLDEADEIGRHSKTVFGEIIDNIKHNIKGLKRKPIYLTDAQKLSMLTSRKFNKFAPHRSIYALNRFGKYGLIGSATLPMLFGAYKHFRNK